VGFVTVTINSPAELNASAGRDTINCVAENNGRYVTPLMCTTEFTWKPLPLMVNTKPEFTSGSLDGVMLVIIGTLFLSVNVSFPDAPPPGLGELTETA
jgi:hypothetical protein